MKKSYIIRRNEKTEDNTYSAQKFCSHIVRKIGDDLAVKIEGVIYKGKDLRCLQMELSKAHFPYVIEELNYDNDPNLGIIYEENQ